MRLGGPFLDAKRRHDRKPHHHRGRRSCGGEANGRRTILMRRRACSHAVRSAAMEGDGQFLQGGTLRWRTGCSRRSPKAWSWEQQKAKGAKGEPWSGVRNHQAAKNMKAMKKGERGFFYHSGEETQHRRHRRSDRRIPARSHRRNGPIRSGGRESGDDVPKPVTLAEAKADPKLADMVLVKFSRLSVQPVTREEWKHICKLGGVKK